MFKKFIVFILLFQFFLSPLAYAIEEAEKKPLSAALKSAIWPGWGQYENGEDVKGRNVLLSFGLNLGLYLVFDQRLKQIELGTYAQDEKDYYVFLRDFWGTGFATSYLGGIIDAYTSAQNLNSGNQFEKKDPMTALLWSALFPGLGQVYIGDNIYDGVFTILHGSYLLNRGIAGNKTEKTWGLGFFGLYYVISLFSYNAAVRHNEKVDKLIEEQKRELSIQPSLDLLSQRMVLNFNWSF